MKIGLNLLLWTDVMNERGLNICGQLKDMGYDSVELPAYDLDYENYRRWGIALDKLGLYRTATVVRGEQDNPASLDPAIRQKGIDNNKRSVECLAAAGCTAMVGPFHSAIGYFSGAPGTSQEWAAAVDSMRQVCEHADQYNIDLCIEPLNRFECYLINCSEQARRFVDDVAHKRCKVLYDTFHAHIEEKSSTDAILSLGDRIGHVHVAENDRSTPGAGSVRWKETFAALRQIQYDGPFVVEAFGGAMPKVAAATKIWRPLFDDEFKLAREALAFIKENV